MVNFINEVYPSLLGSRAKQMNHTLEHHLVSLQDRIQSLRDQLTAPNVPAIEIARINIEIRTCELAISHYQKQLTKN